MKAIRKNKVMIFKVYVCWNIYIMFMNNADAPMSLVQYSINLQPIEWMIYIAVVICAVYKSSLTLLARYKKYKRTFS